MFNLQKGTAAGGNHVEHREGVDDETKLLVRQKGVQQNEAYSYDEQFSCSSIQQAEWNKKHCAAKSSRESRVEVPQKRESLRHGRSQGKIQNFDRRQNHA